jgi:hypothetical protein
MASIMMSGAADNTTWAFPFSEDVWDQTPREVRDHMLMLQSHIVQQQQQLEPRPILHEDGLCGLLQNARAKGNGGSGVEATVLPLIQEVPREVLKQAKDLGPFALPET